MAILLTLQKIDHKVIATKWHRQSYRSTIISKLLVQTCYRQATD